MVFDSYEKAMEAALKLKVYEALYSLDDGDTYFSTFDRTPEEEHPGYFFSYLEAEEWVNTYIGSTDEDEEEIKTKVLFELNKIKIIDIEIVEVD